MTGHAAHLSVEVVLAFRVVDELLPVPVARALIREDRGGVRHWNRGKVGEQCLRLTEAIRGREAEPRGFARPPHMTLSASFGRTVDDDIGFRRRGRVRGSRAVARLAADVQLRPLPRLRAVAGRVAADTSRAPVLVLWLAAGRP